MKTLEQRVKRLEKETVWYRRATIVLGLLIIVGVPPSVVFYIVPGQFRSKKMASRAQFPCIIKPLCNSLDVPMLKIIYNKPFSSTFHIITNI